MGKVGTGAPSKKRRLSEDLNGARGEVEKIQKEETEDITVLGQKRAQGAEDWPRELQLSREVNRNTADG